MWLVVVTYGTQTNMVYAKVPLRESAEALKRTANGLGYHDARVVHETDFYQAKNSRAAGQTDQAGAAGQAPRVHGVRGEPRAPKSQPTARGERTVLSRDRERSVS